MKDIRASPPRVDGACVAAVVRAYQRNFPNAALPLFHADDVLPLLAGDDNDHSAAEALINADRVFYPKETP